MGVRRPSKGKNLRSRRGIRRPGERSSVVVCGGNAAEFDV
jgi:hypothetical protein